MEMRSDYEEGEDEEFESETPEASNEHQEADVNHMKARMMNVNRMSTVKKHHEDQYDFEDDKFNEDQEVAGYYYGVYEKYSPSFFFFSSSSSVFSFLVPIGSDLDRKDSSYLKN